MLQINNMSIQSSAKNRFAKTFCNNEIMQMASALSSKKNHTQNEWKMLESHEYLHVNVIEFKLFSLFI